jgi:hypothetical protein
MRSSRRIALAARERLRAIESRLAGVRTPDGRRRPVVSCVRLRLADMLVTRRIALSVLRRGRALEARFGWSERAPRAMRVVGRPRRLTARQVRITDRLARRALFLVSRIEGRL